MTTRSKKIGYEFHAVKRMLQRRLSVDAIAQIAEVGVTVQESKDCIMKRGDINGKPVHVVLDKTANLVRTVYTADQWDSTITVQKRAL